MATRDMFIGTGRERAWALLPGRIGWPLPTLLIGACLLLMLAYSVRPFVGIDLGDGRDSIYIDNTFHAQEFGPVAPHQSFAWPHGSDRLQIDERLSPDMRMVTLTLDPWLPDQPRRLISVHANDQEVANLFDTGRSRDFPVLLPRHILSQHPLTLRVESLPDKTLTPAPVQVRSVTFSGAQTYRWSKEQGIIRFPALGRGAWKVRLSAVVSHPDSKPVGARLFANDMLLAELPEYKALRSISVLIPEEAVDDGNLTLTIAADPFHDPRPLGVLVEHVSLAPLDTAGMRTILPPWNTLLLSLLVLICLYGSLRWLTIPAWGAAALGLVLCLLGAWAIASYRYPMGFFMQPLALLMLFSLLLTPLLDRFVDWVFRRLDVPLAPWLRRALVLLFLAGLWLKGGGLLFPYMRPIDIGWHMERARWILNGQLGLLYGTNSPLNETTMPINEWGAERPVIPYSPFFHIFAAGFAVFPWSLETSANVLSALADNSRVFLIGIIARKSGLDSRGTLLAALLYAVTPFTFLLHSWGNVPTTFGMWWTLLAAVLMVALYPRLGERGPFALLTVVTLACMLFYTVMAVFHVLFVLLFLVIAWLLRGRLNRRPLVPLALATALAIGLSTLIYYGQYISPIIERTLPYMATLFTKGSQSVGVERPSFGQYLYSYLPHFDYRFWPGWHLLYYGIAIPLLFLVPGLLLLRRRAVTWAALLAWFGITVFFTFAGNYISMVDKQIFYMFPALCLCWAVCAQRYWQRGRAAQIVIVTIYIFTLVTAINLWIVRIANSPIA